MSHQRQLLLQEPDCSFHGFCKYTVTAANPCVWLSVLHLSLNCSSDIVECQLSKHADSPIAGLADFLLLELSQTLCSAQVESAKVLLQPKCMNFCVSPSFCKPPFDAYNANQHVLEGACGLLRPPGIAVSPCLQARSDAQLC